MSDNCCNLAMSVDENPRLTLAVSGANYYGPYQLPTMSADVKGGAKLGSGLEVTDDALSLDLVDSATGTSVTAADASYLASLHVDGKAVQNGTPTPSAPVDIRTASLLWNELIHDGNFPSNTAYWSNHNNCSTSIADNVMTVTVTTGSSNVSYNKMLVQNVALDGSHKYYYTFETKSSKDTALRFYFMANNSGTNRWSGFNIKTNWTRTREIKIFPNTSQTFYRIQVENGAATTAGDTVQFRNFFMIDLTKAFGAGNEPSTTAEVEAMFPDAYYPYNAGTLSAVLNLGNHCEIIDLQGNVLASLPDGTKDELTVDSAGHVELTKRVSYTSQAVTDGVTGTVGIDVLSSTGEIADGADVYYKAASSTTTNLGYIDMPAIPDGASISITAQITPTITASWLARGASAIATAIKALRDDLLARIEAIETAIADL